jgi:hypothetical protein
MMEKSKYYRSMRRWLSEAPIQSAWATRECENMIAAKTQKPRRAAHQVELRPNFTSLAQTGVASQTP